MRFVIAGLGSIGRRHLRNLRSLGEFDIVLYRTGKSTLPAEDLAGLPVETDFARALERQPDAVIVSNPTALHLEVAIPAAEAGCHLLLEKPVSDSMARIDELRRAVARGGGQVLVGFQFRFHPTLQALRQLLAERRLGPVTSVRAHWGEYLPDWHPWEDFRTSYAAREDLGGGALLTLCHPLDYLGWIFGEVGSAGGMMESAIGLEVEAVVEATLRFSSGILASVHLDYLQRPPEHSLSIVGESGRLRWDGMTGDLEISQASDGTSTRQRPPKGFERNDLFLAEMRHFLQVASGEAPPVCGLDDGIRVQEIIDQIRSSARAGGPVGSAA
ncbi:MAG: putative oxidoreductase [Anaerolineales bacterium]|nr:putative oxidoreductase [Anaerolineales bacterium]MBM2843988.1 putative oxidoreductase [Anaerolineales bacterium]